jgi:endonuclease III
LATPQLRRRAREVFGALRQSYPKPAARPAGGIIDQLAAVLVDRDAVDGAAYRATAWLLQEFVDWNEVRVARWSEVERALRPFVHGGASGETARRLVYALQLVFQARGDLNLDGLAKASPAEAKGFLMSLNCLDPDEVSLVLLLALGEQVMPVDGDILRTGKRLGVISHTATKLQAQKSLEASLEGEDLHACFLALRDHARSVCFPDTPECEGCPVRGVCRNGRRAN